MAAFAFRFTGWFCDFSSACHLHAACLWDRLPTGTCTFLFTLPARTCVPAFLLHYCALRLPAASFVRVHAPPHRTHHHYYCLFRTAARTHPLASTTTTTTVYHLWDPITADACYTWTFCCTAFATATTTHTSLLEFPAFLRTFPFHTHTPAMNFHLLPTTACCGRPFPTYMDFILLSTWTQYAFLHSSATCRSALLDVTAYILFTHHIYTHAAPACVGWMQREHFTCCEGCCRACRYARTHRAAGTCTFAHTPRTTCRCATFLFSCTPAAVSPSFPLFVLHGFHAHRAT